MDAFRIIGGVPLTGTVELSGAKNAASKFMIASSLTDEPVLLSNVPRQQETEIARDLLAGIGTTAEWMDQHTLKLQTKIVGSTFVERLSRKNRLSILLFAPLLHRTGEAFVSTVGGDKIGPRPVDFHLETLKKMGAEISTLSDGHRASAKKLRGALIELPYPSVGATETAILAGVLAEGRTMIRNAAREPEVRALVMMLQKMGAIIQLDAGRSIEIIGVQKLHGCEMAVLPDRNEAVSFACMALGTRGEIFVKGAQHEHLITFLNTIRKIGGSCDARQDGILFSGKNADYRGIELETDTHPGFMTDWQQPFVVALTQAKGTSVVHETVYEERFGYTEALKKMGADITLSNNCLGEIHCRFKEQNYKHSAVITGPAHLHGAEGEVPDIRAGLAFVVAALVAEGTSTLTGIHHLDRGYERLQEKLQGVGAKITRIAL